MDLGGGSSWVVDGWGVGCWGLAGARGSSWGYRKLAGAGVGWGRWWGAWQGLLGPAGRHGVRSLAHS